MPDSNIYTSKLNTGKITFESNRIKGALGGSGDGEGYDTIEIVPDNERYSTYDQYLVIDPILDDNSVHVRLGGTLDNSNSKLVIGGLQTHLAVSDQDSNRIVLRTKNAAGDGHYEWNLTSAGSLVIPTEKDILDPSSNSLTSGGNRILSYNSSGGSTVATTNNVYVVDSASGPIGITLPGSTASYIHAGYNFTVIDKTGYASTNNIQVVAASGDSIISAPSGVAIDTDYGVLSLKYLGDKSWAIMYGR